MPSGVPSVRAVWCHPEACPSRPSSDVLVLLLVLLRRRRRCRCRPEGCRSSVSVSVSVSASASRRVHHTAGLSHEQDRVIEVLVPAVVEVLEGDGGRTRHPRVHEAVGVARARPRPELVVCVPHADPEYEIPRREVGEYPRHADIAVRDVKRSRVHADSERLRCKRARVRGLKVLHGEGDRGAGARQRDGGRFGGPLVSDHASAPARTLGGAGEGVEALPAAESRASEDARGPSGDVSRVAEADPGRARNTASRTKAPVRSRTWNAGVLQRITTALPAQPGRASRPRLSPLGRSRTVDQECETRANVDCAAGNNRWIIDMSST